MRELSKLIKLIALTDAVSMVILTFVWGKAFLAGDQTSFLFRAVFVMLGFIRMGYYVKKMKQLKNQWKNN